MPVQKTDKIWHNGKLIDWDDATIHVTSHVVNYGSTVFEGIRCYETPQGPAIFRLRDHMRRLLDSAKIYRMDTGHTVDQLIDGAVETVRANGLNSCYVRPVVLRGYGQVGVDPTGSPIETYIACWPWGKYLGEDAIENGVDVCVSSWARMAPNTLPAMAKSAANYMNSQLIKMEAHLNGYVEGIALDNRGMVSEGSGENLFIVRKGAVITPPIGNSVLPGITRETILTFCGEFNIPVVERTIPREELYIADEVFFVGTATEVTPIRSIDKIEIGSGSRGPVTKRLQDEFFPMVTGEVADRHDWRTPVTQPVSAK